jgi:hypothetical protein
MVAEASACGRWMRRDDYERNVLELTGRVRNVALSVRDRSRSDGMSRGRCIRHRYCDRLRFGAVLIIAHSACLSDVP